MKIDPENRELFRRVKEKAETEGEPYTDEAIDYFVSRLMRKGGECRSFSVGTFRFANSAIHYCFSEWDGRALLFRGEEVGDRESSVLTVVDFNTDEEGLATTVKAVYSTAALNKIGLFEGVAGRLTADYGFVKGLLLETLDARLK